MKSRWLVVVGIGAVLVMAPLTASASARSPRFESTAATSACAHGRAFDSRLRARDVGFIAHFVPCVLRHYRSRARLRYVTNRELSGAIAGTLARFVKLAYVSEHRGKAANAAGVTGARSIVGTFCRNRGASYGRFQFLWADTSSPPPPTPRVFATLLGHWFRHRHRVARMPDALFGVATTRGLLFRRNDRAGAAFGAIVVICH